MIINRRRRFLSLTPDRDVTTLFNAMTTPPSDARKALYSALITSLKDTGVWQRLDVLYLFAAADAQAALINIKAPGFFDATAVNSPTFTADRGFAGDGATSYISTGVFTPRRFTRDSNHFATWIRTINSEAGVDVGLIGGAARTRIIINNTASDLFRNNAAAGQVGAFTDTVPAHAISNRTGGSVDLGYINGVLVSTGANASNGDSAAFQICHSTTRQQAAFHAGESLTPAEALASYNALQTYMTGVGA